MKHTKKNISTSDGPMSVHIVAPQMAGKHPALIVLQEAFGVNHHILDVCERLAQGGYVALAPELFHRAGEGVLIEYADFAKARPILSDLTNARLEEDLHRTLKFAQSLPEVDSDKIGAIGFCMGGFAAILGACRLPLRTAVSFYGGGITKERPGIGFSPLLEEFSRISCPVFLGYGGMDSGIPLEDVELVRQKLDSEGKDRQVKIYSEAHHGFMCDERPSYHPQRAREAWDDTWAWLRVHLS